MICLDLFNPVLTQVWLVDKKIYLLSNYSFFQYIPLIVKVVS